MKVFTAFAAAMLVIAFVATSPVSAHTVQYSAILNGPSEAPPNASPGIGTALVTVDYDLITMRVEASFQGLLGTTSAAHIHGLTAVPLAGTASVATQTPSFSGFPLGVTSGAMDTTFDMTLASSYNAAFVTAQGGSIANAFAALTNGLDTGRTYFNIHSSAFPGGEIRGFLLPVPEPTTAALLALGAPLVLRRRRRD